MGRLTRGMRYNNEPDFFFVAVNNATPGDTLTITGYAPTSKSPWAA